MTMIKRLMMKAMPGDPNDGDDACKPERTAGKTERLVPKTRQMFSSWKRVSIDEKLNTTSYARHYQHYCLMLKNAINIDEENQVCVCIFGVFVFFHKA